MAAMNYSCRRRHRRLAVLLSLLARLAWSAGDHPAGPPLEVQASGWRTGHTRLQDPAARVTPKAVYPAWRPGQDGGSWLHRALDIPARSQEGDRVARVLRGLITTQELLVVQ